MSRLRDRRFARGGVQEEERLVRLLQEHRGWLQRVEPNEDDDPGRKYFELFAKNRRVCRKVPRIDGVLVKKCLSRGWLKRKGRRFLLTEEAHGFLRRRGKGEEGFRAQHQIQSEQQAEVAPGVKRPVTVNDAESPLGWLRKRKDKSGAPLISDAQYEAGERLAREFYFAQLSPRVTANWSALSSSRRERRAAPGAGAEVSLSALAAKARVVKALEAVGPELAGVLLDVCCFSSGLEEAEKKAGWPQRSGKVVLQIGLRALARHYGYISDDATRPLRRRIEHWGAEDFRPKIGE